METPDPIPDPVVLEGGGATGTALLLALMEAGLMTSSLLMIESGETRIVRESLDEPGRGVSPVRFPASETLEPPGLPPEGAEGEAIEVAVGVDGVGSFEMEEGSSGDPLMFRSTRCEESAREERLKADPPTRVVP